jgi:hypothetical protein
MRCTSEWAPDGAYRLRVGWFGGVRIEVKETRKTATVTAPPIHWTGTEFRWRRLRSRDLGDLSVELVRRPTP